MSAILQRSRHRVALRAPTARSGFVAATVASAAIGLHLWIAITQSHIAAMTVLMLGMALVCAPCAIAAWRHCDKKTMTMLMGMSAAAALANLAIVLLMNSTPHDGHGVHQSANILVATAPSHSELMLGVIALELVTAAAAAVRVRSYRVSRDFPAQR